MRWGVHSTPELVDNSQCDFILLRPQTGVELWGLIVMPTACPNLVPERDAAWCKKFSDGKRKCNDCQDSGHHAQHHRLVAVQREVLLTDSTALVRSPSQSKKQRQREKQRLAKETDEAVAAQRASTAQSVSKRARGSSPNELVG